MTATLQTTNIQNAASSTTNLALDTSGNVTVGSSLTAANNITATSGTVVMASSFLRNRIINGAMAIDQRNAGSSQTITAASALAYTVDRWYAYCTGANVTGQRVQGASANQYRYQFTGAASVTAIGFAQRIEAINSSDLAGTTATLSVDLSNSLLTTVTWTAYYANSTDTFGTLASPSVTSIATGSFTVTSSIARYSAQISIPSAATTGLQILFTVGAQTSGTWVIGNVQLEPGSIATPFERRLYGQELTLSQRYCYVCTIRPLGITLNGNALSSGILSYPVTMRTSPTLSNASLTVRNGAVGTPTLQTSSGQASTLDAAIIYNPTNNWSTNAAIAITGTFSAEL